MPRNARCPPGSPPEELPKRAATLEDLANRLIRVFLVLALVFMVFGLFDLWSVIAGLGLFLAALTLAGQSVILDYIMGLLIIIEGQYFKGDTISVGGIEGEVEEVGLRRTVLRDTQGTVHSISNGTIRVSSNLTRIYAVAMVDIEGVREPGRGGGHRDHGPGRPGDGRRPCLGGPHRGGTPLPLDAGVHGPRRHAPDVHQGPAIGSLVGPRRAPTTDGARVHERRHPAQPPDGRQLRSRDPRRTMPPGPARSHRPEPWLPAAPASPSLARHRDPVALLRRDQVVGVLGVVAQVDLDPVDPAREGRLALRPRSSVTGVAVSLPTSVVSSAENTIGTVASTRPSPTFAPSTYRSTVPPLPRPPPS